MSLETIEQEIADLIVEKQIHSKIDSHSKLLYSKKDNEMMNSYKESLQLGKKFIRETEAMLLRVQLLKRNKTLKPLGTPMMGRQMR